MRTGLYFKLNFLRFKVNEPEELSRLKSNEMASQQGRQVSFISYLHNLREGRVAIFERFLGSIC